MPVEFDCEGCGVHVHALGIEKRPADGFCSICNWLNDYIWGNYGKGLDEFWKLYQHCGLNENLAALRAWRTPA